MKAFTKLTDNQGVEIEQDLKELAVFVNCEEIQQIIDSLTYVKEDHSVQHKNGKIEFTHSHFPIWTGEPIGKVDLQIWSTSDNWSALDGDSQ